MIEFECRVNNVEALRVPGINRYYLFCNESEIVAELPEQVYRLNIDDMIVLSVLMDKEKCIENDFCGQGYVVTSTKINNVHRIILSMGGLLIVMKVKPGSDVIDKLKVVEKYYIGIKRLTK